MFVHQSGTSLRLQLVLRWIQDPKSFAPFFQKYALHVPGDINVGARISTAARADWAAEVNEQPVLCLCSAYVSLNLLNLQLENVVPGAGMPNIFQRESRDRRFCLINLPPRLLIGKSLRPPIIKVFRI